MIECSQGGNSVWFGCVREGGRFLFGMIWGWGVDGWRSGGRQLEANRGFIFPQPDSLAEPPVWIAPTSSHTNARQTNIICHSRPTRQTYAREGKHRAGLHDSWPPRPW